MTHQEKDSKMPVESDFMMVADGAQAVGGKLYVLGGGWSHLFVSQLPGKPLTPFAVALGLRVSYDLTNRRFTFTLEVVDADGQQIGEPPAAGEFEVGRPPGLRPGTSQTVVFAIVVAPEFPAAGRYEFRALVDGDLVKQIPIEVVQQPGLVPESST
jgi:hypothetical protein